MLLSCHRKNSFISVWTIMLIRVNRTKHVLVFPAELRTSLEEHQSALELIMTKYREQVFRLLMASKRDDPAIVTQLKEQHTTVSRDQLSFSIRFDFSFDGELNNLKAHLVFH